MSQCPTPVRVVVAPDSYKESLSAAGVANAIAQGVRDADPQAEILCVPMADGGEGSLDAVLAATGGERRQTTVRNANGQACEASWGWLGQQTAFIEMAAAAGLEGIPANARKPLQASTYGVGQLILQALDAGARRIVLGLGGSATTDGGAGLFQALELISSTPKAPSCPPAVVPCIVWPPSTPSGSTHDWPTCSSRLPSMSTILYVVNAALPPSSAHKKAQRRQMLNSSTPVWRILQPPAKPRPGVMHP